MIRQRLGYGWLLLTYLLVAGTIFQMIQQSPSHYCSTDSYFYLRMAENLLSGKGPAAPEVHPFVPNAQESYKATWPIGYPGLIALMSWGTGLSTLWASKVVNLLCLALIFGLLAVWVGEHAWIPALYLASHGKLAVFAHTWSEGPFLLLTLLLCYTMAQHHAKPCRPWFFIPLSLLLMGLFSLRYAGILHFGFLGMVMVWLFFHKKYPLLRQYAYALVLAMAFAGLYLTYNYLKVGYLTGEPRPQPEDESLWMFVRVWAKAVVNEGLLVEPYEAGLSVVGLLAALGQVGLLGMAGWCWKRHPNLFPLTSDAFILWCCGLFYLVGITLLRWLISFDPFDFRIFAPFSMPFAMGLLLPLAGAQHRKPGQTLAYAWGMFMALGVLVQLTFFL